MTERLIILAHLAFFIEMVPGKSECFVIAYA